MNLRSVALKLSGLALALSVCLLTVAAHAAKKPEAKEPRQTGDALFSGGQVWRIEIEVAPESMGPLEKSQSVKGMGTREDVKATIREGGKTYPNVALHLKGAIGSFRTVDKNPAFTLDFGEFQEDQTFHGLRKLHLNNSVQDPTFISEQLSRELFNKAGVPTPRAAHARVRFNNRDLGLYVLVEGVNKQFLRRHFKDVKGNLYDGGLGADFDQQSNPTSGDKPDDRSELKALREAIQEKDPARRWQRLNQALDVERFLSLCALDALLWNWDGYAMGQNNYRLFHDRANHRVVFFPTGLDQTFHQPDGPVLPNFNASLARVVIHSELGRQRFLKRMKELEQGIFRPEALTQRVREIASLIRPVIAESGEAAANQHDQIVADYSARIVRRCESIRQQLDGAMNPARFNGSDPLPLTGWESQAEFGAPVLAKNADGTPSLSIGAPAGTSIGGWHKKLWLEAGRYRIEGRVKTSGVVPCPTDPFGGTGLRIAQRRMIAPTTGTQDWRAVQFDFQVREPVIAVDLICEFRAASGTAWFDESSLRLRKISESEPAQSASR